MSPPNTLEHFESLINRDGDCWLWRGTRQSAGYGSFNLNGKRYLAHRLAYKIYVGEIPKGLELDHLCRTSLCVNPAHLEAVTHRENLIRGNGIAGRARDTHCQRGHPFDEVHMYITPSGRRRCRTCQTDGYRDRRAKVRAKAVAS